MKLYYRGVCFEYDPTKVRSRKIGQPFNQVRESAPAYNLIYRGVTYRAEPKVKPASVPLLPATYKLIYRGITYFVNKTVEG
jgi:YHS domain-containing protein